MARSKSHCQGPGGQSEAIRIDNKPVIPVTDAHQRLLSLLRESDRCSAVEWQLGHKSSTPVTGVPIRKWVRLKKCIPIRQTSTHGKIQQESLACKHLPLF
jgi:hypothetical protein